MFSDGMYSGISKLINSIEIKIFCVKWLTEAPCGQLRSMITLLLELSGFGLDIKELICDFFPKGGGGFQKAQK